jgi:hypothetical protein|tara:strand:+ start:829 stop:1260 length:432 start_codon:yes stop_codon:yes gene_type:complete
MDIISLLNLKLEKELFNELKVELGDTIKDEDLTSTIRDKIDKYPFFIGKKESIKIIENQCCARCMGPRYSDIRCSKKALDGDYCKKHAGQIVENDYLKFGRYDEPRPIINENGNKIPWRDTTALEDINTLIQYQHVNLQKLIK